MNNIAKVKLALVPKPDSPRESAELPQIPQKDLCALTYGYLSAWYNLQNPHSAHSSLWDTSCSKLANLVHLAKDENISLCSSLQPQTLSSASPAWPDPSALGFICTVVWCPANVIPLRSGARVQHSLVPICENSCLVYLHHLARFWFEFIDFFQVYMRIFLFWSVGSYTDLQPDIH